MFPITVNGNTYNASDFTSLGYETAVRNFVEDCNAHFAGSGYSNDYSHYSCAFFSGSYTPSVGSASFTNCLGGEKIRVGSQVVVASLTTNKRAFGVVSAESVVSGTPGNVTKNFTVQVSNIYAPAGAETGWLILPYGFPQSQSSTLTPFFGGTGVTSSEEARSVLRNPLPSQSKKTIFEDFLGISQEVTQVTQNAAVDGVVPSDLYCGAIGNGRVDFRVPSDLASEVDGNCPGVAVLTATTSGEGGFIALNNAPIAFPGVGSVLSFRFKIIGASVSNAVSVRAGFLPHSQIPSLPSNFTLGWGMSVDLLFDRFRVVRDYSGQNYNLPIPGEAASLRNSVWYKAEISTTTGNNVSAKLWREDVPLDATSQTLGNVITANNSNLVVPFFKLFKTSGTSTVRVLLDYIHWRLPGAR